MKYFTSELHNERTFYQAFIKDLENCKKEVIIESPFITTARINGFRSVFNKIIGKGVRIYIFTRDPREHEYKMAIESETEIRNFEKIGVQTLIALGNHHRKLAILDREILWEGSLNILSQSKSREIMRKIKSKELATEMFEFLRLGRLI